MKKISFARAHQVLSEKEMKNVLGGSGICPEGYPYIFRCSNGNLVCCKVNSVSECCI